MNFDRQILKNCRKTPRFTSKSIIFAHALTLIIKTMKLNHLLLFATIFAISLSCNSATKDSGNEKIISEMKVKEITQQLIDSVGKEHSFRIERGVQQVANLWRDSDGTTEDFAEFCKKNFAADDAQIDKLFNTLERNFEVFDGYFHKMDVLLKEPLQLEGDDITPVDMMFGSYDAASHLNDDLYANKIAFLAALNFPFYSLQEKTELGEKWSRKEWAYARMGDRFIARVPADIQQNISKTLTEADAYISDYNIFMGKLRNDNGEQLFPDEMKLISHWGFATN